MRILLDYRPALRQRTGVGEYAHELVRALSATSPGPEEELVLFSASWKDRLAPAPFPDVRLLDRRIPNRLLNLGWHRFGWPSVESLAGGRVDVAQAFHPLLLPSRHAARLVTIHDLDFLDHPERTVREIRRDYAALAPDHARRADHVIVNSNTTRHDVETRLGVPASRITVCSPGAPPWSRRDREPETAGCILFLGTLEPRKNVEMLLDAYERLRVMRPDAPPLVLAGAATPAASSLLKRVGYAPLAGHVELPGYIAPEAREALYRRALVLVMPSHTEGFGMPVLEAMTVGVPVVIADRGALPEVAAGAGQRFEPDDIPRLAAILDALLASPDARASMREAGWRRAEAYSWRASADRLRGAWADALARRGRRG